MKFVVSYSCGKDSALALYRMIEAGHQPVGLLVMINREQNRSWFHGVDRRLRVAVSDSLNIPLIECVCRDEDYNTAMEKGLYKASTLGADAAVFGDIDIEGHREWATARCEPTDLNAVFPLWGEDRLSLTREVFNLGFQALIKCVDKDKTDPDLLGETLTAEVVDRIVAGGADACGENGEYHTFVYDGPIFSFPLPVKIGQIVDFGTHAAIDVQMAAPAAQSGETRERIT